MENERNHKHSEKTFGLASEKSTRQQAIEWWNSLSQEKQIDLQYLHKSPCRHPLNAIGLTGREIEEIWRKEVGDLKLHKGEVVDESYPKDFQKAHGFKTNQKQYNPKRKRQDLLLALLYNIVNNENVQKWFNWDAIKASEGFKFSKEKTISDYDKIWKEEIEKCKLIPVIVDVKPNQKQYSQEEVDRLLDQQAAITTSQILKSNQKQFKEFNAEFFKAYINKFSDEDKLKAFELIMRNLDIQEAKLVNDGFNLGFEYKQF